MALLLAAGADASAADADGLTPLHVLADCVLANYRPSLDEDSNSMGVPGWGAMARAVGALVAAGADMDAKDRNGRTARDAVAECIKAVFGEGAAALLA